MQKFTVTNKEAGRRLDKYLKLLLPQAASGFLYKMLRKKNITLNGKKAAGNETITAGDIVELFFSEETFRKFSRKTAEADENVCSDSERSSYENAYRTLRNISIVYEDEDIMLLNKPAGVLSQKAKKEDISLNEWLLGYLLQEKEMFEGNFRPSVCNRLDRNTSGIVLCGKSVRGSQFLAEILRERTLHKYYTAYVQGRIEEEIKLDGYLKKEEENNRSTILSKEEYRELAGKQPEAEKEYKRVETVIRPLVYIEEEDDTKLEILLITGKSHQIRAHLAAIGHPVLGDLKYGWKPRKKSRKAWKFQMLHAGRIEFPAIEGRFAYLSEKSFCVPEPWEGINL